MRLASPVESRTDLDDNVNNVETLRYVRYGEDP